MKNILLLFLLALNTCFAQTTTGVIAVTGQTKTTLSEDPEDPEEELDSISSFTYRQVVAGGDTDTFQIMRLDTVFYAEIDVPNTYTITWELIESASCDITGAGEVWFSGAGNTISFTPTEDSLLLHPLDVRFVVSGWGTGEWGLEYYARRGVRQIYPGKFTAGAGVSSVSIASCPNWNSPPANKKVLLTGGDCNSRMDMTNWTSTKDDPYWIQVEPGAAAELGFMVTNSKNNYVIWDGCTQNSRPYGLVFNSTGNANFVIDTGSGAANFGEITQNIIVSGAEFKNGWEGHNIRTPDITAGGYGSLDHTLPQYALKGFSLFNSYLHDQVNEHVYDGHTRDWDGNAMLDTLLLYNIITEDGDKDAFQPGNTNYLEMHNCTSSNWALENNSSHWSGISINHVNGYIHHNTFTNGAGKIITGSTGSYHGRPLHIFRNSFSSTANEDLEIKWLRWEDNSEAYAARYAVYRNDSYSQFDKQIGLYCNSCGSTDVYWNYSNNNDTGQTADVQSGSGILSETLVEHFMAAYDLNGFKTVTLE